MVPPGIGNGLCVDDELNVASGFLGCVNRWMDMLV